MGLMDMGLPFTNQRGPHVGKTLGIQESYIGTDPQLANHGHYLVQKTVLFYQCGGEQ